MDLDTECVFLAQKQWTPRTSCIELSHMWNWVYFYHGMYGFFSGKGCATVRCILRGTSLWQFYVVIFHTSLVY